MPTNMLQNNFYTVADTFRNIINGIKPVLIRKRDGFYSIPFLNSDYDVPDQRAGIRAEL